MWIEFFFLCIQKFSLINETKLRSAVFYLLVCFIGHESPKMDDFGSKLPANQFSTTHVHVINGYLVNSIQQWHAKNHEWCRKLVPKYNEFLPAAGCPILV